MTRSFSARIAAACREVTPPLSKRDTTPLLGFTWERAKRWDYAADPLFARALWIKAGDDAVAVVSVDMIGDALGFGDRARQLIETRLGLPAERVMVACTHAHATPETIALSGFPIDEEWLEFLSEEIAGAVSDARERAQPARLYTAAADLPGLTQNRRLPALERFEAAGGKLSPQDRPRAAALDTELRVLWAETQDGRVNAALVNFAVHPVTVQTRPFLSADIPGHAMRRLDAQLGGDGVGLFLNGATGDINPRCDRTIAGGRRTGERLADAAVELIRGGGSPLAPPPLEGRSRRLVVPRRPTRPEEELRAALDQAGPSPPRALAEEAEIARRPEKLPAEVQALVIGELSLVGLPGEYFCCLGREVKAAAAGRPCMVAGYANGYLGYLCPRFAYDVGGYETSMGRWSPLDAGAADQLTQEAIRLLAETFPS